MRLYTIQIQDRRDGAWATMGTDYSERYVADELSILRRTYGCEARAFPTGADTDDGPDEALSP